MIKEINSIKFIYKGRDIIDEKLQEKIDKNWNELLKKSELFHESDILIVTNLKNKENDFEIEIKESKFSHYMYAKITEEINIQTLFSGAYILTSDSYIVCNLSKYYEDDKLEEVVNLTGGMADIKDIINGEYSCENNIKREFKEELGIDLNDNRWSIKLKYLKYPSEKENSIAYPIGTIYEAKTSYTKDEVENIFKTTKHDNETSRLIYFNKDNYKDIHNYKQKKEYMTELWEKIFD